MCSLAYLLLRMIDIWTWICAVLLLSPVKKHVFCSSLPRCNFIKLLNSDLFATVKSQAFQLGTWTHPLLFCILLCWYSVGCKQFLFRSSEYESGVRYMYLLNSWMIGCGYTVSYTTKLVFCFKVILSLIIWLSDLVAPNPPPPILLFLCWCHLRNCIWIESPDPSSLYCSYLYPALVISFEPSNV